MPQRVCPYLTIVERSEMLRMYEAGDSSVIKNKLFGSSKIDVLTDDYAKISLSESSVMEMKLFVDSIGTQWLCLVSTVMLPQPNSSVSLFTSDWQNERVLPIGNLPINWFVDSSKLSDEEQVTEIAKLWFPKSFRAQLHDDSSLVTLTPIVHFPYSFTGKTEEESNKATITELLKPDSIRLEDCFSWDGF